MECRRGGILTPSRFWVGPDRVLEWLFLQRLPACSKGGILHLWACNSADCPRLFIIDGIAPDWHMSHSAQKNALFVIILQIERRFQTARMDAKLNPYGLAALSRRDGFAVLSRQDGFAAVSREDGFAALSREDGFAALSREAFRR